MIKEQIFWNWGRDGGPGTWSGREPGGIADRGDRAGQAEQEAKAGQQSRTPPGWSR